MFPATASRFCITGPAGPLEVMTTYPTEGRCTQVMVICHPNPLHQGTMDNKVVSTLARAAEQLGLASVRFNFRGVGQSAGEYGDLVGEQADLQAVLAWVAAALPGVPVVLAGFSFGSYIAAMVARHVTLRGLISIAPPINMYEFSGLDRISCPWLVVMGEADEIVPFATVAEWASAPPAPLTWVTFPEVGHFFHGHLIELREQVMTWMRSHVLVD